MARGLLYRVSNDLERRRVRMAHQRTVRSAVSINGVGLHSGMPATVRVLPAPVGSGVVFVRTDLDGLSVPASHRFVQGSSLATTLARGRVRVRVV